MSIRQSVILGLLAAFLAGCSQPTVPDPDSDAQSSAAPGDDSMSEQAPMDDDGMGGGGEFFDDDEAAMTMIIYFDFDKSELRAEYADVLARHASGLSNNSRTSLRLEGHTDERGSREYNIGLGERRSQSVRRMLLIQGASTDQISTVSFGEERPAAFGSDEDAFQQNRRVEIKYTN